MFCSFKNNVAHVFLLIFQAVVSLYGISDLRNIGAGFSPEIEKVHESPAVTEALLVNGPAFGKFPGASILQTPEKALNQTRTAA